MTRAGEKLYGDWDRTSSTPASHANRRRIRRTVLTFVALVAVAGTALFGFG